MAYSIDYLFFQNSPPMICNQKLPSTYFIWISDYPLTGTTVLMIVLIPSNAKLSSATLTTLSPLSNHYLCGSTSPVSLKSLDISRLEDSRKRRERNKLSASLSSPLTLFFKVLKWQMKAQCAV